MKTQGEMTYGSVCSGIEAASVAWAPLGWRAAWFAEIEAFPSAVLAHHYPEVPNLGDMTKIADMIRAREILAPDVLVGGTPCQSFSVAGLRKSLADDRGNLALQFIRIANAIDDIRRDDGKPAAFVLWENVPGVLSVQDNAFGTFLAGLSGCDAALVSPNEYGWSDAGVVAGPERCAAWRVLDAQFFGLAQRRRRVFVLARGGVDPWSCADALLPIIESMQWHPAPRRQAGEGLTHDVAPSLVSSGRGVERGGDTRGQDPVVAVQTPFSSATEFLPQSSRVYSEDESSPTLQATGARNGNRAPQVLAFGGNNTSGPIEVATACAAKGGSGHGDFETETFVAHIDVVGTMPAAGGTEKKHGQGWGQQEWEAGYAIPVAHALRADEPHSFTEWHDRTKDLGGTREEYDRLAPIAFSCKDHGNDVQTDVTPTMRAMNFDKSHANAGGQLAVAFDETQITHPENRSNPQPGDPSPTLAKGARPPSVAFNVFPVSGQSVDLRAEPTDVAGAITATQLDKQTNRGTRIVDPAWSVRRLTPEECETLQGFPIGYTMIPWRSGMAADGPRYKSLGNSFATFVVRYIGERIVAVENERSRDSLQPEHMIHQEAAE